MIRLEDFSKLSQVPVKKLRYFDAMGLLVPINVNRSSGHRYYSASQFPRLNRILVFEDLGLSAGLIAQMLNENLSQEQLRGMLRLKRAELQQRIDDEQAWLARVEAWLKDITMVDYVPDDNVVIKQVEPQLVAGIRDTLPSYSAVGRLFYELNAQLARLEVNELATVRAAIWHDDQYKTGNIDGEAVVYLKQPISASGHVKTYELPAALMSTVIHKGAYNTSKRAYEALGRWIETNGYRIVGPNREIYLHYTEPVRQDDDSYVTEIQLPVAKIELLDQ